jgi:outer membrane protein
MAFGFILNQRAFDFGLNFNRPGTIDNFNTTAMVGVPLYTGGRISSGKRAAEAGVNAAEFDEVAARHQLVSQTVQSYLNIRKTIEVVTAVEAGVEAYTSAVNNAQLRFEAGQMLKADLLSLEVQLAQTREQLVEAQHHQALAERAFIYVLGLPSDGESVELMENDPSLALILEPESLSYQARPELQALFEREKAATEMKEVATGERRPSVSGFASVQYDHGWQTNHSGESWLAGVAVDLKVFDGGNTTSKVRQAEAQLSELREYIRKAELGIGLEVEQARLALVLAKNRVSVTGLSLQQAEESAALSRARFEEGALLTAELIGVESRLMEARMRRAVALADEIIAIADLRRAVGFMPIQN